MPNSSYLYPEHQHPEDSLHVADHLLPWGLLSGLIQGNSVIEQGTIQVRNTEEAHRFIKGYGYDLGNADDAQTLRHLLAEAIHFIENRLLEPGEGENEFAKLKVHLPDYFLERQDIIDILIMASQVPRDSMTKWACAILKVLHTLVHIENTPRLQMVHHARRQILKEYSRIIRFTSETGKVELGRDKSDKRLLLYGVEIKEQKTRDSLLIKLLSKKDNQVDIIDDLIGIRIVTESVPDVLLALDILMDEQLIVFSNVKANRTRNTLIELNEFQALWKKHRGQDFEAIHENEEPTKRKLLSWGDLLTALTQLDAKLPQSSFLGHNPNSASNYHALHLTTRHLVKVPVSDSLTQRMFFPYEIQFIDKAHYIANQEGEVAHSRYKQRQLQHSRRRILGDLLPAHVRDVAKGPNTTRLKRPFEATNSMTKRNLPLDSE